MGPGFEPLWGHTSSRTHPRAICMPSPGCQGPWRLRTPRRTTVASGSEGPRQAGRAGRRSATTTRFPGRVDRPRSPQERQTRFDADDAACARRRVDAPRTDVARILRHVPGHRPTGVRAAVAHSDVPVLAAPPQVPLPARRRAGESHRNPRCRFAPAIAPVLGDRMHPSNTPAARAASVHEGAEPRHEGHPLGRRACDRRHRQRRHARGTEGRDPLGDVRRGPDE